MLGPLSLLQAQRQASEEPQSEVETTTNPLGEQDWEQWAELG